MSLTSFLKLEEVAAKVKPFRPKLPRKIPVELKVEPRSNRHMLVGTAFDYLLRFELQRRAPHAVVERWVSENAPDRIWKQDGKGGKSFLPLRRDDQGVVSPATGPNLLSPEAEEMAKEVAGRARCVVEKAKSTVAAYVRNTAPSRSEQAAVAAHAIRLAKLDELYRSGRFDPSFEEAAQEDVEDLLGMLDIAPFGSLLHDKVLRLNPTFGETSRLVGGADCDLITGDLLVDFKTTKSPEMQANNLDQLLGYFLLARQQRRVEPAFPEINRVGLYFCRHAHLWELGATTWTERADFLEVEQWFLQRAKEESGARKVRV
jgi:hypothetical protein